MIIMVNVGIVSVSLLAAVPVAKPAKKKDDDNQPFTPAEALRQALASPLTFVGKAFGEDIGIYDYYCLWRNKSVVVRTDYCSNESAERQGDEGAGIYIYSPAGSVVHLYHEVSRGQSAYQANEESYLSLSYENWASVSADSAAQPSFAAYRAFAAKPSIVTYRSFKKLSDQFETATFMKDYNGLERCFGERQSPSGLQMEKDPRKVAENGQANCRINDWDKKRTLEKAGTDFLQTPSADWGQFLGKIQKLMAKHKQ